MRIPNVLSFRFFLLVCVCIALRLSLHLFLCPSFSLILSLLELSSTSVDSAPACPFSLYFIQHLLHVLLVIGCCCSCCPSPPCCCFPYCSCCCCFWINKCHMWLCGLPACPVLYCPNLSWPASIFVFIRFAVMATTLDALRSTASALCPF